MVLVEYLNSGCYSQLHLIESRMKAMKCGFMEGIYWSVILCLIISVIAFRFIIGSKKLEIKPDIIKNYAVVMMCIVSILITSFFTIGYTNKWNAYQKLIIQYRKQGITDYQINYLLEMEQQRNSAPYMSALASTTSLAFLGKKETTKETTKETQKQDNTNTINTINENK